MEEEETERDIRHVNLVFFDILSSGGTELEILYQMLQVSSTSPQGKRKRKNPSEPRKEKVYKNKERVSP